MPTGQCDEGIFSVSILFTDNPCVCQVDNTDQRRFALVWFSPCSAIKAETAPPSCGVWGQNLGPWALVANASILFHWPSFAILSCSLLTPGGFEHPSISLLVTSISLRNYQLKSLAGFQGKLFILVSGSLWNWGHLQWDEPKGYQNACGGGQGGRVRV